MLDLLDTGDVEERRRGKVVACRDFFWDLGGTINNETNMKSTIRE